MRIVLIIKLLFIISLLFISCKKEKIEEKPTLTQDESIIVSDSIVNYLHISHTRTDNSYGVYSQVKGIDFTKYDMLWLGGDLSGLTSANDSNIAYVSSIYDTGNENTLWSIGNHDYTNLQLVESYTNRPPFYTYYKNGITFIVLDTQDSLSNIVGEQLEMFNNVIDTISESSYLVILHHKLIWMYGNSELESQVETVANGWFGSCFYCINPNNFYQDIYPSLVEVKQKDISVICLAGDIGFNSKKFEYLTPDSINFLASGMRYNDSINYGLVFKHNITKQELTWSYKTVLDL